MARATRSTYRFLVRSHWRSASGCSRVQSLAAAAASSELGYGWDIPSQLPHMQRICAEVSSNVTFQLLCVSMLMIARMAGRAAPIVEYRYSYARLKCLLGVEARTCRLNMISHTKSEVCYLPGARCLVRMGRPAGLCRAI